MGSIRVMIQFKLVFVLMLHGKLRIWFIAGVKVTEWPKSIGDLNCNYKFGQCRTRGCVRTRFRNYVCACTQEFGLWFGFMFRVRVAPALQRGTFKVGITIHWYSDLHTVLTEFGFSIMIGYRIRVVLTIWILCLSVVSFRLMGEIKARLKFVLD